LPETVIEVPGAPGAPGAKVPPELICVLPTVPVPPNVPPVTVRLDAEDRLPFTRKLPPWTVHGLVSA
jgi:hypothetical protein